MIHFLGFVRESFDLRTDWVDRPVTEAAPRRTGRVDFPHPALRK